MFFLNAWKTCQKKNPFPAQLYKTACAQWNVRFSGDIKVWREIFNFAYEQSIFKLIIHWWTFWLIPELNLVWLCLMIKKRKYNYNMGWLKARFTVICVQNNLRISYLSVMPYKIQCISFFLTWAIMEIYLGERRSPVQAECITRDEGALILTRVFFPLSGIFHLKSFNVDSFPVPVG